MRSNVHNLFAALCLCLLASAGMALEPGEPVPPLVESVGGTSPDILPDYAGKVLYIDFWASWCGPCRKSLPALNELYGDLQERGLEVLAVNLDESKADMDRFLEKYPVDYRIVQDPQGINPKVYGIPGLPTAYIVDRSGTVQAVHIGFKKNDKERLRTALEALLDQPASP